MDLKLGSHQIQALRELKTGKVLKGGVGSGKSRVACMHYFNNVCHGQMRINGYGKFSPMKKDVPLYIITSAKKRDSLDWQEELSRFGISLGENREGAIDSWNRIIKYQNVKNAFFIFDEQRLVGNGTWVSSFYKIARNNDWIVLSATPGDVWMDFVPIFIANGFYKNRTDFVRKHVIYSRYSRYPKIERYINTDILEKLRDSILVHMPYERHTSRHIKYVNCEYDQVKYKKAWKERWHVFEDRPIKDIGELFIVIRKIVNQDRSRIEKIKEIFEKHPRLIVFYNFDYELEILRTLKDELVGVPIAEYNGHKHEDVPDGPTWIYLTQYMAGAEAWNCTTTNAIAFYSMNYSYRLTEQARGRIDRMNTQYVDLYYYVLKSSAPIDIGILRANNRKRNFSEARFAGNYSITEGET